MRILITGGTGLLGGRLAKYFQDFTKHHVTISSRVNSLEDEYSGFKLKTINWDSRSSVRELTESQDVIIHASGMNSHDCLQDPAGAKRVNGDYTRELLRFSEQSGVRKFIYISTAHVYGSPLAGELNELVLPNPKHPYATSHLRGEEALMNSVKRSELQGTIIRLSNAYGYPLSKNSNCWMLLINDLCRQVVKTRKIVLNSSGLQTRNFISLSETSEAIHHLIKIKNKDNIIFNVGSTWSPTIIEVAQLIQKIYFQKTGVEAEIIRKAPHTKEEVNVNFRFDISKLKKSGFIPSKINSELKEINNLIDFCNKNF